MNDRRRIHDISPPVSPRSAVWPGDTAVTRELLSQLAHGESVTLSTLHATVHVGAHADAPSHIVDGTPSIDVRPLHPYIGPCVVVHADVAPGELLGVDAVPTTTAKRVLFRTGTQPDPDRFDPGFAALDASLVHQLADRGVVLVGIDTPSVDPFDSKDLPAHRACVTRDVAILEGLVLDDVAPGRYELIALPLRLEGFDASPVRAILRDRPEDP